MTQVIVPPMLSCRSLNPLTSVSTRRDASLLGQRTGLNESTLARVMVFRRERNSGLVAGVGWVGVGGKRNSLPMLETKATISTPEVSWRIFSAIAPAATRPIKLEVSRPL